MLSSSSGIFLADALVSKYFACASPSFGYVDDIALLRTLAGRNTPQTMVEALFAQYQSTASKDNFRWPEVSKQDGTSFVPAKRGLIEAPPAVIAAAVPTSAPTAVTTAVPAVPIASSSQEPRSPLATTYNRGNVRDPRRNKYEGPQARDLPDRYGSKNHYINKFQAMEDYHRWSYFFHHSVQNGSFDLAY